MTRFLSWTPSAWADYEAWQSEDRRFIRKINILIKDTLRDPFSGIGKPEALRLNLSGLWSRRIDQEHRLVYQVTDDAVIIVSCRTHYKV
ncbi:MAG: Txe/YoeB family addiction module toxin [Elstera sp.]